MFSSQFLQLIINYSINIINSSKKLSKTKILYTIPNFKTAGSQYVLLSLYRGIDRNAFDPYICVEKYPELFSEDIPTDRRLVFEWTGNKLRDILNFKRLLKKHKIDIVHSWDYKSNYLESFASKIAGVNYLFTKKNNTWSRRWKLKSFLSKHIAYDNPEMKHRFFSSSIFQNKTSFIPHGVDIEIFKPREKIKRETFNLGCTGNIGSNKNQLFLIKALRDLPASIHLHLFGNQDELYREKIDEYIELYSLSGRVHFNSFVANSDIPNVYRNIDLFVLASLNEGLPVSILEAMACGVPALSSDSGGGATYLLRPEYIFSLENTNELISKILRFYNMKDIEKDHISNFVRSRVLLSHSLKREVSDYENLYRKLESF